MEGSPPPPAGGKSYDSVLNDPFTKTPTKNRRPTPVPLGRHIKLLPRSPYSADVASTCSSTPKAAATAKSQQRIHTPRRSKYRLVRSLRKTAAAVVRRFVKQDDPYTPGSCRPLDRRIDYVISNGKAVAVSPLPSSPFCVADCKGSIACDDDEDRDEYSSEVDDEPFGCERMRTFELDWEVNQDIFMAFLGEDCTYQDPRYYVDHAIELVKRFNTLPSHPDIPENKLRMIAFLVAVKANEDLSVYNDDFLWTFESEFPDDFDLDLRELNRLERDFLKAIDWNIQLGLS